MTTATDPRIPAVPTRMPYASSHKLATTPTTYAPVAPVGTYPPGELAAALHSSPELTPDPEWAPLPADPSPVDTGGLVPGSGPWLHSIACGCEDWTDVAGHGVNFAELAAALRRRIADELAPAVRHPVEAKVWAGAWGTLAVTVGLALVTLLLDELDVLGATFGGEPWAGPLMLVLSVVLPPVAAFLRGYGAPHTARPAVDR